jgi:hypothetical protein
MGRSARSPFQSVLALAAGRPVFTADLYVVDGVSGKVRSIVDWNDATHVLDQSVGANQVAVPAPHADFGGARCFTFTGVERYQSNRVSTAWAYLHSGAGSTLVHTHTPLGVTGSLVQAATTDGTTGTVRGVLYYSSAASGRWLAGNGAATLLNPTTAVIAINVPTYLGYAYVEGAGTPEWTYRQKGALVASGDSLAPPDPGAPQGTFTWGASIAGTFGAPMRARSLWVGPILTAGQLATLQQWIQQDTGIAP